MKIICPAVLLIGLLAPSNASAQDTERYRVPQAARESLVAMKAAVHHGSAGGDFTADLTPAQADTLRQLGFELQVVPDDEGGVLEAGGGWTSHAQMRADFLTYAATYPNIAEYHVIGTSVQGREIFGLRITDNVQIEEDEPEVAFWASIHGDEFASGEIAYDWAMDLLDAYGIDPVATAYVDDNEIWVVPLLNPDGHDLGTRNNVNGVDLNRDIGWNWDGWGGSSSPYSQPESQALQEFLLENNISLSQTMHCSGNVYLYPWCDSPEDVPEKTLVQEIGFLYSSAASYQLLNSWSDYETHGEVIDLLYGGHGSLCYTAEISNSLANYADAYSRNSDGMDAFCAVAGRGLAGLVTDAQTGEPLRAAVYVSGSPYPAYTDPVVGDVHRMVLPGTYSVTVWANGYVPQTVTGLQVAAASTTQFQVALQRGGGDHAFFVTSVNQRDPNNAYNNLTSPADALGAPDGVACSLGSEGFIVLDMGAGNVLTDGPGDDFTVTEALVTGDQVLEQYRVFVGDAYDQDTLLGAGTGTASFDLADGGVSSARYVRIASLIDPSPNDPLAGMELDGITSVYPSPWTNVGGGSPGVNGVPQLVLSGPLTTGSTITLELTQGSPSSLSIVFISFDSTPAPFLGGTLHAFPVDIQLVASTDPTGSLGGSATFPGAASGSEVWFQVGIQDFTVPIHNASLSNGVVGAVP